MFNTIPVIIKAVAICDSPPEDFLSVIFLPQHIEYINFYLRKETFAGERSFRKKVADRVEKGKTLKFEVHCGENICRVLKHES